MEGCGVQYWDVEYSVGIWGWYRAVGPSSGVWNVMLGWQSKKICSSSRFVLCRKVINKYNDRGKFL